jgi:hypothetical protein
MAHGFKHVPRQRTASPPERRHGSWHALNFGTYVSPTRFFPLESEDEYGSPWATDSFHLSLTPEFNQHVVHHNAGNQPTDCPYCI